MKIVHIVEGFGGGVYSFLVDLCNSLADNNEVILVYNKRKQTPKNFEEDFNKNVKLLNVKMSRAINPIKDITTLIKIFSIIRKERPDVIHLHSSKAGVLGRIVAKLQGYDSSRVFYNPHGYAYLQQNISNKKRKIYFLIEKLMASLIGTIVAVSKGEFIESKKISDKVVRIDNSIDTLELDKVMNENEKRSTKVIGTLGRITYQKNPEMFNSIAKKFPNIKFLWIGDGELRNELTAPNISITGWKERYEAIEEVNKIDIYLQTSLWEGLPIALLEVMYLGKAVIVNDVIGNRDVIINEENGFITNNVDGFATYINKLLKDEKLYTDISRNAKRYIIKNHNIKDMLSRYSHLYYMGDEQQEDYLQLEDNGLKL